MRPLGSQQTTRSGRRAQGFTLLEVLVATAILGIAVAALFGLLSSALGNMRRLQGPAQALLLGQSRMNELLAANSEAAGGSPLPLDQKMEGRWNGRYRWEAVATRANPSLNPRPGQLGLVRIVVDVFWKPAPDKPEKKLSLETYQLQQEPQPGQ